MGGSIFLHSVSMTSPLSKVIVVGGGLAGLSSAHTILENGGNVLVLDKNAFMGGNSTKATSGINGTPTRTQRAQGVQDGVDAFLRDTIASATGGNPDGPSYPLAEVLVNESAPAVEWLIDSFGLDLSLLGRLGGHSFPRTHRGKERFPGMTITYALMEKLEEIEKQTPDRAKILTKARCTKLLTGADSGVIGCEYQKDGQTFTDYGAVVICTGGYGADFTEDSLLKKYRPDVLHLPTTNGDHCTGDGIKLACDIGGSVVDMEYVQVHPTGLVNPEEPEAKLEFLAAEALRGCGALLLDATGNRFCNELGRRDYVSEQMMAGKGPFRLVLNGAASREIEWHCKHYVGRGLMKHFKHGSELAKDMGISPAVLEETFRKYNDIANSKQDPFGKKFFQNAPFKMDDYYNVAIVTPVVHYTMGGIHTAPNGAVCRADGSAIPGLFAAGEISGGVRGKNRLGGSSLLDCVVFGRVSGRNVSSYVFQKALQFQNDVAQGRLSTVLGHVAGNRVTTTISQGGVQTTIDITPGSNQVNLNFNWGSDQPAPVNVAAPQAAVAAPAAPQAAAAPAADAPKQLQDYTKDDVAKHNTEKDCWVIVNGQVLNVTDFLPDHPGGKKAILLFAGKDASEEFNMLHKPDVVEKYAPDSIIGNLKQ